MIYLSVRRQAPEVSATRAIRARALSLALFYDALTSGVIQGMTWDRAWTFPADQSFSTGFGPGYNCEYGLLSANNRSKLLLSKPTATLHGDSTGAPHSRRSPGSCVYRRNLTIAVSENGGDSWAVQPWGLVYTDRVAYSDMAELPSGKVAVVFERGTPAGEYRFLSVAIVRPPWAAGRG